MKIFKYIFIAIVFLGSEEIAFSQYYLRSIYDSLNLESDSVILYFDEDHLKYYIDLRAASPGTIDWQASSDLVNWRSLGVRIDSSAYYLYSLGVRIDSSAYYRAVYTEGTCSPVMSDTAFLTEKVTVTGSNVFTVDSLGGVFLLPSGIKVKIPRGAVSGAKNGSKSESKEIKVAILGFSEADSLATIYTDENVSYLTGISISTDVFDFTKPIKIKIPVQNLDVTGLPLLYKLDTISSSWFLSTETLIVIPKDEFVEIVLNGSDQESNNTKGKSEQQNLVDVEKVIFDLQNYRSVMTDFLCREKGFTSKTQDHDFQSSGGCAVSRIENKIVYHECGSKEESYSATEISPSCVPQLNVPGGCIKIIKGKPGQIELSTSIGGLPLPNQTINVNPSSNISAPSNTITLSDGTAALGVTGIEVGTGSISFSVPFDYYLSTVSATGAEGNESNSFKDVQKPGGGSVCATVIDVPKVTTAPVSNIECNSAMVGGIVTDDNLDPVTERGVEVNGSRYPSGSGGIGSFSFNWTGLECNKTYTARAYATNIAGTGFGGTVSFIPLESTKCKCVSIASTVKDSTCTRANATTIVAVINNEPISERGIYYGELPNPEITGTKYQSGNGAGSFTIKLSDLKSFTTYYAKGYAITDEGPYYGIQVSFSTGGTVTDIEGNIYNTVTIGDQEWMAENLKTGKLNDRTSIPFIYDQDTWENLDKTETPGCCLYNNYAPSKDIFGLLYNWYAVGTNKLCPAGWHVPSRDEWIKLENYLIANGYNYDGTTVGNKISKAMSAKTNWNSSSIEGAPGNDQASNNSCCFSGLPSGLRANDFGEIGNKTVWWSSTEVNPYGVYDHAYLRYLEYNYSNLMYHGHHKVWGFSVRCVKNADETKGQSNETYQFFKSDSINGKSSQDLLIIPTKDKEIKLR